MGLFDNVFKNSEQDKLNNEIAEEQRRMEAGFAVIGRIYYERHKEDPEIEMKEGIIGVNASIEKIRMLNQRIAQLQREEESRKQAVLAAQEAKRQAAIAAKAAKQGGKQCTKCGTMLSMDAMFCYQCGTKAEAVATMAGKPCIQCNTMLAKDALFCVNCGTKQEPPKREAAETAALEVAAAAEIITPKERRCTACNTNLSEGALFCPECGTKNQ